MSQKNNHNAAGISILGRDTFQDFHLQLTVEKGWKGDVLRLKTPILGARFPHPTPFQTNSKSSAKL